MTLIWSDEFSVGVEAIDADHMALFRFYNELGQAVQSGASFDVISEKLDFLGYYCISHFSREEDIMNELDYPDLPSHTAAHDALQAKFVELLAEYKASRTAADAERMYAFVGDWLSNHILGDDMRAGTHIRRRLTQQAPCAPQDWPT